LELLRFGFVSSDWEYFRFDYTKIGFKDVQKRLASADRYRLSETNLPNTNNIDHDTFACKDPDGTGCVTSGGRVMSMSSPCIISSLGDE
jgi:hypothetical protein